MAYDGTIPSLSNQIGNDIPQMQENFELLEDSQVVDEGSTADGDYIRYENGWQVFFIYSVADDFGGDGDYLEEDSDYPQEFLNMDYAVVATPVHSGNSDFNANISGAGMQNWGLRTRTETFYRIRIYSDDSNFLDGDSIGYSLIAIGRWK